ncbi:MAG: MnhB domain-containing protein [Kiritimatiellae bacterium]|nr:MnhB domain-containing protein [Kiritimatiellia bacterium]MDD4341218.1 MnhB domain-containing protein [Kiritimatiellia bacterium]
MNMTKIVRTTADVLYPFCLVFGLYIVAHGHLSPGGGFQGGSVMATGVALLIVSRSYTAILQRIRKEALKLCEAIGLLMFLVAALSGLYIGGSFLHNWLAGAGGLFGTPVAFGPNPGTFNTAGVVPILNLAVGLEVLGGLAVILLYMLSGLRENTP